MNLNKLENSVIQSFKKNQIIDSPLELNSENIFKVCLMAVLQVARVMRKARFYPDKIKVTRKEDGSPSIKLEIDFEKTLKKNILQVFPDWNFLGEEGGEKYDNNAINVAVDPIDGTYSYISHDNVSSISLAVFKRDKTILGLILNPFTGEIGYAIDDQPSRLLQLGFFCEDHEARNLPSKKENSHNPVLINLQPSKGYLEIEKKLKIAKEKQQLRYIKSMGGSPANALLEAAKGHYIYVHPWQSKVATHYDLAAGVKILENANGITNGIVNTVGHLGLFVAGINKEQVNYVWNIIKK